MMAARTSRRRRSPYGRLITLTCTCRPTVFCGACVAYRRYHLEVKRRVAARRVQEPSSEL